MNLVYMNDQQILQKIAQHREFEEDIRSSKGYQNFRELLEFRISFFVYRKNYIDFKTSIKEYYSTLDNVHNNTIKRGFRQRNLIRHIHNVLFSSRSLVNNYWKSEVLDDTFHCFMKELRNYITHRNSFPLTSRLRLTHKESHRFESMKIDGFVEYLKNEIREHPKWKGASLAEAFIKNEGYDLNLNDLLISYNDKLHERFKQHVRHHFSINEQSYKSVLKEVEEYNRGVDESGRYLRGPFTRAQIRYIKLNLDY